MSRNFSGEAPEYRDAVLDGLYTLILIADLTLDNQRPAIAGPLEGRYEIGHPDRALT
tara:strand:- start:22 stop:192 length:171 start_codon:yes stop_codon:yes gene_type:complete